mgnify:CR=1 FL=1
MPHIAAHEDVKANRVTRELPRGKGWRTNFLTFPDGTDVTEEPMGFLVEGDHERIIRPHYHENDQFQVVVDGGGAMGKHPLSQFAVHFSRAYTPYGPITFGDSGLSFLTLRARKDPGAQYLPELRDKLKNIPARSPWQMTEAPDFTRTGDVAVNPFTQIKDERGLAAYAVSLKPHATLAAPDHTQSGGQHIIVTRGSLAYQGKDYKAITIAFVKPDEAGLPLVAGADGLEALVLNYPRKNAAARKHTITAQSREFRVWQCALCAFVYDEAKGMPHDGIAPGTRWEDVPDTWTCPDCAASKADFAMEVVA